MKSSLEEPPWSSMWGDMVVETKLINDKKKGTDEGGLKMEGSTEEVVVNMAFPNQKVVIGEKLSPEGKIRLKSLLKRSLDGLAWQQCDMVGILRDNLPSSVASMDLKPCSSQERRWDVKDVYRFQEH
ncbi:hypothetical protein Tco_1340618 [Tanacetum coccineum]